MFKQSNRYFSWNFLTMFFSKKYKLPFSSFHISLLFNASINKNVPMHRFKIKVSPIKIKYGQIYDLNSYIFCQNHINIVWSKICQGVTKDSDIQSMCLSMSFHYKRP